MSTWKINMLDRAQRIAQMSSTDPEYLTAWNELEDDIHGKISIWQARQLADFVMGIHCQGSMVILAMLPDDIGEWE